jgi:hypothetical protein
MIKVKAWHSMLGNLDIVPSSAWILNDDISVTGRMTFGDEFIGPRAVQQMGW